MNMTSTVETHEIARERFTCQSGENEMIEILLSIASVPLVGPPPRPKFFDLELVTPAGARFVVHGEVLEEFTTPLVDRPPPPDQN